MRNRSFLIGLFSLPIITTLMLIALFTPAYVPSDSLISAAASTSSRTLAQDRMIASFVGRCRRGWKLNRERFSGRNSLYSWENDAGLVARTDIVCLPGERCSVTAHALVAWPFPGEINGKPLPKGLRGCRMTPPDWLRQPAG